VFNTRETVPTDTPAANATSDTVGLAAVNEVAEVITLLEPPRPPHRK
jgi:hypothetical protein